MANRTRKYIRMVTDEEWDADLGLSRRRSRDIREILADIAIFSDLTADELRQIGWILHSRTFLPLEVIVRQGAPGVGMYIIQSGSANVELETSDGGRIHLATLGERQFFGEMSLLDGAPRAASVMAAERTQVLGFFKADLMGLIEHAPQTGYKIVSRVTRIMARRLRDTLVDYRAVNRELRAIACGAHNQEGNTA